MHRPIGLSAAIGVQNTKKTMKSSKLVVDTPLLQQWERLKMRDWNSAPSKMQGWKMQNWNYRHHIAGGGKCGTGIIGNSPAFPVSHFQRPQQCPYILHVALTRTLYSNIHRFCKNDAPSATENTHTTNNVSCLRMSVICYVLNADSGR